MSSIAAVFAFSWPYLRRYWVRLVGSVLFGLVFALSNSSFMWAASTLACRFDPDGRPPASERRAASAEAKPWPAVVEQGKKWVHQTGVRVERAVDPWLPRVGQPLRWQQCVGLLAFFPLLVVIRAGSDYLNNYYMGWATERVIRDMRLDIMTKLSALSLDFFNRFKTGDLLTRINIDTQNLMRCLRVGGADLIKESLTALAVFVGMLVMDPMLTLMAIVLVPACLFPLIVLGKKARRATRAGLRANVSQSGQLVELLSSIRVVKAFSLEKEQLQRFRKTSAEIVHAGMKGVQAKEMVNPLIEVICVLGVSALLLYVFSSGRSGRDLLVFLTGAALLLNPIKKLAGLHILFEQAGVGVQRLQELQNERPTVRESAQPAPISGFEKAITFENVHFAYTPDREVVRDFSLTIPRGQRVGLAGESGCGKTTLLNLLYRFYDTTAGQVKLDGHDVRELAAIDLRRQMALVSQEIVVFDQTIAENIACGRQGATREEIEAAAKSAFAHDFIVKLPHGYDTQAGERGVTLSGGQRQRICIARAFIRNAPILVLDEATASLDSKSEAEVQAAIERLAEHRTVICVAHRLSTLASMDQIIVLHEGRMVESGTFNELLQQQGIFASMAARQGIFPG